MNATGIRKILTLFGASRVKSVGQEITCSCPFAPVRHKNGTDRKPSFGIRVSDTGNSSYHCFSCGIGGTSMLSLIDRLGNYKLLTSQPDDELRGYIDAEVYIGFESACAWVDQDMNAAHLESERQHTTYWPEENLQGFLPYGPYIASRGILQSIAVQWGVLYDLHGDRVLFPVRDQGGGLVGVQARLISTGEKLNELSYPRGVYLYGEHLLRSPVVVITEGPFDALTVAQAGFPALALFGSHLTETQAKRLRDMAVQKVVVLLDGDDAGRQGAAQVVALLHTYRVTSIIINLPDGEDPNSIGADRLKNNLSTTIDSVVRSANLCS